jgi:hypothetical protein
MFDKEIWTCSILSLKELTPLVRSKEMTVVSFVDHLFFFHAYYKLATSA